MSKSSKLVISTLTHQIAESDLQAVLSLFDQVAIISIASSTGEILYCNQMLVEVSGYAKEELIGSNHRILKSDEHPPELFQELYQTVNSGGVWRGEIKNLGKNGNIFWLDMSVAPVYDESNSINKYIEVSFVITDKKLNEEKLAKQNTAALNILEDLQSERVKLQQQIIETNKFFLAVENTNEHIVITDTDGIVLYANKAAEKTTGFSKDEILGTKAGVLWGGKMDKAFYAQLWETIKVKKQTFKGEVKNIRKNGLPYISDATISPIIDDTGKLAFFVGIERDITQEKNIDRAKTEFVSLASHQLRTPLTAINWYSELLLSDGSTILSEEQKKYLNQIALGSRRMSELVSALLNVSRIELGTFAIEPELTSLIKLLRSVLDELKVLIDEKQIHITVSNDDLPEIAVDPKLFRMVYQNLLTNAIKYTPEEGKVNIEHHLEKDAILISISDTGYGIPDDQKERIFQKLFRADNVRELDTQGTGLGLYIVKSIIDQSEGKIWFDSKLNQGTTFFVRVPLSGMKKKDGSKPLV